MSISFPSSIETEIFDALTSYAGREGKLFRKKGGRPPTTPSRKASHKISLEGQEATPAESSAPFRDGTTGTAQVSTVNIANNSLTNDTDTYSITVDGITTTFTFMTVAVDPTDVEIGVDATATELNLKNAIASEVVGVTADISGGGVRITADVAGDGFTQATNVPAKVTLATTTPNVTTANATLYALITGRSGSTPIPNTRTVFVQPFSVNGITRNVRFIYITQEGDDWADIAAGVVAVYTAGLDNTTVTNGFIKGLGKNDTRPQLKDAMREFYGAVAATAFTVSNTSQINFLAGGAGAGGNNMTMRCYCQNSPPSPLVEADDTTGIPQDPGIEELGKFTAFGVKADQTFVTKQYGTSRSPEDIPTTNNSQATMSLGNNARLRTIAEGSASSALVDLDQDREILLFNAATFAEIIQGNTLYLVFEDDDGGFAIFCLYKCFTGNLDFNANIGEAGEIQVAIKVQSFSSRADRQGYMVKVG